MNLIYALMALSAGVAVTLQGVFNTRLRESWGILPTLILNTAVILTVLLVAFAASGARVPDPRSLAATQPVLMLGGICGLMILVTGAIVFGKLGAATALALFLVGQFTAALVVDATGWLGMPMRDLGLQHAAAMMLILSGVALLGR